MEDLRYKSPVYGEFKCAVVHEGEYAGDGSPCITLYSFEPMGDGHLYEEELTRCIAEDSAINYGRGCAYLNNDISKETINFIEKNGLGEFIGHIAYQGFSTYKLYHFDMERIEKMGSELEEYYKAMAI